MATKVSRAVQRRTKKQRQKEREREREQERENHGRDDGVASKTEKLSKLTLDHDDNEHEHDVIIEYVAAPVLPLPDEQLTGEFTNVISRFSFPQSDEYGAATAYGHDGSKNWLHGDEDGEEEQTGSTDDERHSFDGEDGDPASMGLSKKKLKKLSRMTIAELKQHATHPEVVEWEDVTAPDPKLLVDLKAARHTVPVPRHWSHKRKYLAGKRGYLKPPFELPAFIRDTGITELRDTMRTQDATKRIKVKAREKMHPKLGRISVDYERLHDAFFKYQTKPPMTVHGDLYYEGRELEGARTNKKPGFLSEELRAALGLTSHLMPPPWLQQMQRYGPPPAYPHMRIPGLNAPIPEGAQWGYHPGGWGRPPSDHFLRESTPGERPGETTSMLLHLVPPEHNLWGELEPEEEEEEEEREAEEEGGMEESGETERRVLEGETGISSRQDGSILVALDEEQVDQLTTTAMYPPILSTTRGVPDHDTITMNIPMPSEPLEVRKDRRRR